MLSNRQYKIKKSERSLHFQIKLSISEREQKHTEEMSPKGWRVRIERASSFVPLG